LICNYVPGHPEISQEEIKSAEVIIRRRTMEFL